MIILAILFPGNQTSTETEMVSNDGGYYHITSSRLLTEEDIKGKTKNELKIMRNEIFARHGYIFGSKDMKQYFSKQSWYRPTTSNVTLSSIEHYNVNFIKSYEQ